MKNFLSIILAMVLVIGVGGSLVNGTMAAFFDIEVSTDNHMCSGVRMIEVNGDPVVVYSAVPCTWYERQMAIVNVGTLNGRAWLHILDLVSIEDQAGTGAATTEPELVAEEGGVVGEDAGGTPVYVPGLGVDCGDETLGLADLVLANFIDVEIWYDENNDGTCEKLVASGKLADIECQWYDLGLLPASTESVEKGGGWGTYFPYTVGSPLTRTVLVAGQHIIVGTVTVETVGTNLIVTYNTSAHGWAMAESHLYVDDVAPVKMAPGKFPYTSNPDNQPPDDTMYDKEISPCLHRYSIPLSTIGMSSGDTAYIAAHASNCETAWAMGESRKLLIRLHFPDIDEDDLGLHYFAETYPEAKWDHWPTNAYMGDKCIFDIQFLLAWEGQVPPP